jgi:hypothetical protein
MNSSLLIIIEKLNEMILFCFKSKIISIKRNVILINEYQIKPVFKQMFFT